MCLDRIQSRQSDAANAATKHITKGHRARQEEVTA